MTFIHLYIGLNNMCVYSPARSIRVRVTLTLTSTDITWSFTIHVYVDASRKLVLSVQIEIKSSHWMMQGYISLVARSKMNLTMVYNPLIGRTWRSTSTMTDRSHHKHRLLYEEYYYVTRQVLSLYTWPLPIYTKGACKLAPLIMIMVEYYIP